MPLTKWLQRGASWEKDGVRSGCCVWSTSILLPLISLSPLQLLPASTHSTAPRLMIGSGMALDEVRHAAMSGGGVEVGEFWEAPFVYENEMLPLFLLESVMSGDNVWSPAAILPRMKPVLRTSSAEGWKEHCWAARSTTLRPWPVVCQFCATVNFLTV